MAVRGFDIGSGRRAQVYKDMFPSQPEEGRAAATTKTAATKVPGTTNRPLSLPNPPSSQARTSASPYRCRSRGVRAENPSSRSSR